MWIVEFKYTIQDTAAQEKKKHTSTDESSVVEEQPTVWPRQGHKRLQTRQQGSQGVRPKGTASDDSTHAVSHKTAESRKHGKIGRENQKAQRSSLGCAQEGISPDPVEVIVLLGGHEASDLFRQSVSHLLQVPRGVVLVAAGTQNDGIVEVQFPKVDNIQKVVLVPCKERGPVQNSTEEKAKLLVQSIERGLYQPRYPCTKTTRCILPLRQGG